jgi:hypothetical protein
MQMYFSHNNLKKLGVLSNLNLADMYLCCLNVAILHKSTSIGTTKDDK